MYLFNIHRYCNYAEWTLVIVSERERIIWHDRSMTYDFVLVQTLQLPKEFVYPILLMVKPWYGFQELPKGAAGIASPGNIR